MSETQLGKRAGKRNMNLMSKEFWAKTTRAAIDDPMTASLNWMQMTNLTWLTSCSCGCSGVVCDKVVCDKVVCDKVVWERWCVWPHLWMQMTNLTWLTSCSCGCSGVVCDKVVCVTKLCVTELCGKDGAWQSCGWKMVCDEVVWQMVCDKVVCERWCVRLYHACHVKRLNRPKRLTQCHECHACHAKRRWMWDCPTPATQSERGCEIVPRLPREPKVDVRLRHNCHAKCRSCATPATQSAAASRASRASRATKPSPSAPLSAMSATPATRNEGGCEIAPRLPRKTNHAKCRGVTGD